MIVAIDGPSGAGKSTVARLLAQRLGFRFLDTGAMYRATALRALRLGVDWNDPQALGRVAREADIAFDGVRVLLDGQDVTEAIRTLETTAVTGHVAGAAPVREELVRRQRVIARQGDTVTEGRDQGTVAFPDAECKFFITASSAERARRRVAELRSRGVDADFDKILAQQNQRDRNDAARAVGPLVKAPDAIEIVTDGLDLEEVVSRLESQVLASRATQK